MENQTASQEGHNLLTISTARVQIGNFRHENANPAESSVSANSDQPAVVAVVTVPPSLSVASLRRASPSLHSPDHHTRILRLTEAEHSSRRDAAAASSASTIADYLATATTERPRSNPRRTTPSSQRYESPLNPDEFRRYQGPENGNFNDFTQEETVAVQLQQQQQPGAAVVTIPQPRRTTPVRRLTIRPMAGSAVGTVASTRVSGFLALFLSLIGTNRMNAFHFFNISLFAFLPHEIDHSF